MLKILFIVSTLKKTGPINMVYTLINELDKNSFDPIILTLSKEDDVKSSMLDDFKRINTPIFSLNLTRFQGLQKGKYSIKQFALKHQVNIIHNHGLRPDLLTSSSNIKIPIISSIHSNLYDDYTLGYGNLIGKVAAYLHIKSLKGKTSVACSNFVAQNLSKRYKVSFKTILNGVSFEYFSLPSISDKEMIRNRLRLNLGNTIFISAASFIVRKSPQIIIEAFLSSRKSKNSVLIMLGDGPLLANCKEMTKGDSRIIFLGNIPNVKDYLKASDYYISASQSEGLPIAVMEAMSCGLPIILSNIPSHQEILNFLPNWPYTFDVNSSLQLSKIIDNLHENDLNNLSLKAHDVIENKLNSKMMTKSFETLYHQSVHIIN